MAGTTNSEILELDITAGYKVAGTVLNATVDNTNTTRLRLTSWGQLAGNLVTARSPMLVWLTDVEAALSSAALQAAASAAATSIRAYVKGS